MPDVPEIKIYDTQFNMNEWAVLIGFFIGVAVVMVLPRRFSRKLSILYFICGAVFAVIYDFTLGTIPTSFYDIGDNSKYDVVDVVSIFMYAPYSYLFFYLYDLFRVKPKYSPLYIFMWTMLSMALEWGGVQLGVYHYNAGFWIGISFEIYLFVHTSWMVFYYLTRRFDQSLPPIGRRPL